MLERPVRVQEIVDEHCRGYPNELMNRRRGFREEHRQDYKSSVAHTQGHERYGIELQTFYPHRVVRFARTERPVVVEEEIGNNRYLDRDGRGNVFVNVRLKEQGKYAEIHNDPRQPHDGELDECLRTVETYPPGIDDKLDYVRNAQLGFSRGAVNKIHRDFL